MLRIQIFVENTDTADTKECSLGICISGFEQNDAILLAYRISEHINNYVKHYHSQFYASF